MGLIQISVLLLIVIITVSILSIVLRDFRANKTNIRKGNTGELLLKDRLRGVFPEGDILHNLVVDLGEGKYSQIDFVVVDKSGIYVIECKNYNCIEITGSVHSRNWSVRYANKVYSIYSPIAQNNRHTAIIANILGMNITDINSTVVFVKDTELNIQGLSDNSVITMSNLNSIKRLYNIIDDTMVTNISNALGEFTDISKRVQKKQVKYAKKFA